MVYIGEEYGLGVGDYLIIYVQCVVNLGELEGGLDEMVQVGGDKEFFKEIIDEDFGDFGIFYKIGEGGDVVGYKGLNSGKGDGVEDNYWCYCYQCQFGVVVY